MLGVHLFSIFTIKTPRDITSFAPLGSLNGADNSTTVFLPCIR